MINIHDVTGDELPQIAVIERECFSMPWTEAQLAAQLKNSQHEFISAISEDGTVQGYVGMMYVLDEGYISNVAVKPVYRRQGIADALIVRLKELCREHELSFVTLEVRASNEPAIALYTKHGFEPVGRRKNYYSAPREDAILMTYYLNRGL